MNQYKEFNIILYNFPTSDLFLLLGVKEYAFIEHDLDINENGEIKKIHYHLYVKLHKKKTFGGVYEIINKWKENSTQPHLIENTLNVAKTIRYLIHKDDIDKYQYNINDILSNFDIQKYFSIEISDSQFISNVLELIKEKEITTFTQLTYYAIENGKIDIIMKRAYFFQLLIKER